MAKSGTFLQFPEDQEGAAPLLATKLTPFPFALFDSEGNQITDVIPSLVSTEVDHWLIHMGVAFEHSAFHTVPANGGVLDHIMVNTTDLPVHLSAFLITSTQGDATLTFYQGVTSDDLGDPVALHNKHFDSPNTATLTVGHGDAITPIANLVVPAGTERKCFLLTGAKKEGGTLPSGIDEFILKKDEKCLLRYVNNSNTDDVIVMDIGTLDVGLL